MLARESIRGILVMMFAALFVLSFAYTASAFQAGSGTPFTYTGKIVALDDSHRMLTVQDTQNNERIFDLNHNASIEKCNGSEMIGNLKVGDEVTVSYYEKSTGEYVADIVTVTPGMFGCCS
jgi:hypothetical protein